jgi:hypothetical protein
LPSMSREEPFRVSHVLDGRFRSIVGVQARGAREFFIVAATIFADHV